MNKALFIISLQHELAMAIGNKLDLKAMLKVFLKVCFNRLNLTSTHIYIHCDENNIPTKLTPLETNNYQHLLSIPKKKQGKSWVENSALSHFTAQLINAQENISKQCENGRYFFGFIIPDHGLLIFETHYAIDIEVQKALLPILQKLSTSCYTSLVHDSLVKEVYSRQLVEEKVAFQAQHDGLTGLVNRQHLNVLLAEAIEEAHFNKKFGCVVFIDLNRFKPINDSMGHTVGDQILLILANRLQSLSGENIDVARFGGDEFVLLIRNLNHNYQEVVTEIISDINQLLAIPFVIKANSYKLSCSIGYVFFPLQSSTVNNIIKFADIAMYEAKRNKSRLGKQYHSSMSDKIKKRLAYVEDMKQGLKNGDFKLFYQPQYNHSGDIIGAEALLRWQHPIHGIESPAVYIPIAEESDLILNIGQWVLEQACADIHKIEQLSLPNTFKNISINVSAKQLIQHDFQDKVMQAIKANNILAEHLGLELTENLLVENIEDSIKLIASFKANAITSSIDDFGTGYSSLTYLKRIPARVLKIDRSFVANIEQSNESVAIASMIISLGKTLHMNVLAEGVETIDEFNCLKMLGCYQYQGYYFNRPLPFEEFIQLFN
ncbi:bifunctional diguanylate cyclase/phosphodiesterase [Colwellia sp. E2M01]|uniref:putative bifunctional diguanylate cyclase/phosphodiesterase n=1 Tax=Colwellia sp. E2M01 TaxID=2841561 RepID=UPI001C086A04|nr:bifunctional diguanylate cyclase/phosphodiesterase [Colwellia sp. E2M01]MBU2872156.1 bifunctional diguanylate cyclase/phosphodiesterase [Colwellia sp. E2M01]